MSNSSPEVWPVHSLVCQEGDGLASEIQQKGTLKVKNIQLEKTKIITVLEGDQSDDDSDGPMDGDDAFMQVLRKIYSCALEGNDNSLQRQKLFHAFKRTSVMQSENVDFLHQYFSGTPVCLSPRTLLTYHPECKRCTRVDASQDDLAILQRITGHIHISGVESSS